MKLQTHAWVTLTTKDLDEQQRLITGTASTPVTDRQADVMDPKGAVFSLPLPLLWQHDVRRPIGHVTKARVDDGGIEVVAQIQKGIDYIDEAWELIKRELVRGLSIGFRALEFAQIKETFGVHYTKWEWLELSAVTVAANQDASISSIKALDLPHLRALTSNAPQRVVRLDSPPPAGVGAKPFVIRRVIRT
jgi:uncharacterized protein